MVQQLVIFVGQRHVMLSDHHACSQPHDPAASLIFVDLTAGHAIGYCRPRDATLAQALHSFTCVQQLLLFCQLV